MVIGLTITFSISAYPYLSC